ncbi:hypothetical protein ACSHT2_15045 [Bradyrhizobium sp. PUT101]|uniref:hypothetical protein n=1 Tax=Bradyrhizobium sp. PUT101 TaxID=3447427 RepID=UPI003F8524FA
MSDVCAETAAGIAIRSAIAITMLRRQNITPSIDITGIGAQPWRFLTKIKAEAEFLQRITR